MCIKSIVGELWLFLLMHLHLLAWKGVARFATGMVATRQGLSTSSPTAEGGCFTAGLGPRGMAPQTGGWDRSLTRGAVCLEAFLLFQRSSCYLHRCVMTS